MNLINRYKRLSFWNKLAVWGSVASIVGIVAGVILWFFPLETKRSSDGISLGSASHSAVVQGTGNVVTVNNFAAGSKQINNPLPRPGLRLLGTNTQPSGTNVVTIFKFGSLVEEKMPTYSIDLEFARPYDKVQTTFEPLSFVEAHGGLDGQSYSPTNSDRHFKVSGRDLGQTHLVLEFTAPYAMDITNQMLFPPSPQTSL
jgi:hypothetical protein